MIITSSITNEAVDDLALTVGDDAFAVIKASDVMIAISLPGSQPAGN
jgi:molybdopterin-binding protein